MIKLNDDPLVVYDSSATYISCSFSEPLVVLSILFKSDDNTAPEDKDDDDEDDEDENDDKDDEDSPSESA